ncbi:MAG: TIGR04283 family arsenosugar biosynthesis glycosyltransferase [Magnetococcales bacterium]|nr:TIGR04283 family arsenosugar biosynthesis glycosyltransferase [Magnetococcales bacterium]
MTPPRVSVIVPTWNEAATLPGLLAQLRRQSGVTLEILVADGGSTDGTRELARQAGVRVVDSGQRGRGAQMNAGARVAAGDDLLFLHADSGLPDPGLLRRACAHLDHIRAHSGDRWAGHFRLRFVDPPFDPPWILRYFARKTVLNRPEGIHGDQGLLLSRSFFAALGGFDTGLPFLEDQRLSRQVARLGRWTTLPGTLETSARRFRHEGVIRRMLLNAMILTSLHADFPEFLQHAPRLYRTQDAAQPLRLRPFLRLVRDLDQTTAPLEAWKRWYRIGRFLRRSVLGQLFFLLDLLATPLRPNERFPLVALHDRVIQPLLDFTPVDALLALLSRFATTLATLKVANHENR